MKGPLAPGLKELIQPHTGVLEDVRPTARGFSSDFLAVVKCDNGSFFVKAMENKPGRRRTSIICERAINPFVRAVSPPLLWHAEDDAWIALGFEAVDGRPSDLTPDSPDMPAVIDLINRLGELGLPTVAQRWRERRWDRFAADEAEAELFRGDALLHTDINPSNMLIGDSGSWVVDWAGSSRGAALIDPAELVMQLVASGHSPESAESWAGRCKAWVNADPKAIDAFAAANVRMFRARARERPDESWFEAMAEATGAWATYRSVTVT
jgi:hypothetical protein